MIIEFSCVVKTDSARDIEILDCVRDSRYLRTLSAATRSSAVDKGRSAAARLRTPADIDAESRCCTALRFEPGDAARLLRSPLFSRLP